MDSPFANWRNKLLRQVEQAGLLQHPRRLTHKHDIKGLVGSITVEGHTVQLRLYVDPLFQNQLPVFFLQPWDALGFIPHIDTSGMICFLEQEGIVFDWRRPFEVLQECFYHVRRTLSEGITAANQRDFVDEFEVYWGRLQQTNEALSDLEPSNHVAEVIIGSSSNAEPSLRISQNISSLRHIANKRTDRGPWLISRAIYLPLEAGTTLVPPRSDRPFWGMDDIRLLLTYCSAENREHLELLARKRFYSKEYLILGLPRPAGGKALFGIRFDEVQDQHPMIGGRSKQIMPIVITRRDKNYLVRRGGGDMAVTDKRVLLLGCGAVGGHIAFELSRAGVEQLILLDFDTLQEQNTYRHVLGRQYWGTNKALALKQALRRQLPFSQAQAITTSIEVALEADHVNLTHYDLIISAMGNPTSELALNEHVRQIENGLPIIFTWLEPLGIGGHALLTGIHKKPGCLECLYSDPNGSGELHNRASFAAPGQTFRRSLAGCDSLHTPYGSLDAAQTAQAATRLAIDVLTGKENQHRLRSWKGNSDTFTEANFILAPRYRFSVDKIAAQETSFASPTCRICSIKTNEAS